MRVDELERELRAERIEPDPEFSRELDEWAAAGFPRRRQPGALERLRTWVATRPPRRFLLPAGAVATAVVVGAVAISREDQIAPSSGGSEISGAQTALPSGDSASGGPPAVAESAPSQATAADADVATSSLAAPPPVVRDAGGSGGGAFEVKQRKIAQKVDLSLSTAPKEFRDAADGVLDVVATHNGFVVTSDVSGGDPSVKGAQPGQANFKLKIPAGQLPAALSALSDLGHVVARTDGTEDITGRFVGAKERIAEYSQARQNLLAQLEDAVTEAEQASIRARLRIVEAQLRNAEGDLGAAQQRVHLVPVSVAIAADPAVANHDDDSDDSGWSLGDAVDDAGNVLTVMAGIGLVSLAVLVPLALVGLVLWWGAARIRRQQRERALDVTG
jgi:hypothetical protein